MGAAWSSQLYALRLAGAQVRAVAEPDAPIKSATLTFQRAALASGHMLPVYGSSELYCCGDPYRATQLFASEPTGFDAFAVGRAGTGNVIFMQMFGALGHALEGRKLVVVDSPPWFGRRRHMDAAEYAGHFSPEIAYVFIFDAPISLGLREAAARQMAAYPQTLADEPLLRAAVQELADPTPLHLAAYLALFPLGRLEAWIEQVRDAARTLGFTRRHRPPPPVPAARQPPPDWVALAAEATRIAERRDTSNPFGFPDQKFRRMAQRGELEGALAVYRSGSTNRDGHVYPAPTDWEAGMLQAAEWTDLRLALAVLRELGAEPLVWTLPMPGFYDDYTPLSAPARQAYYRHWQGVMEQAGVPWLDFRTADEDPYFLTDTGSHLSPRGWIFADRALDMFWHGESLDEIRVAQETLGREVPPPAEARESAR